MGNTLAYWSRWKKPTPFPIILGPPKRQFSDRGTKTPPIVSPRFGPHTSGTSRTGSRNSIRPPQLGYANRPKAFPHSLALIGLHDVRDYKVASGGSDRLTTASPFNIKAESLSLGDFTAEEVAELYHQHTADTAQTFADQAIQRAFHLTQGNLGSLMP